MICKVIIIVSLKAPLNEFFKDDTVEDQQTAINRKSEMDPETKISTKITEVIID